MSGSEESKNCKVESFRSGPHSGREQMEIRIKYQEQSSELRDSVYMLRGGEIRVATPLLLSGRGLLTAAIAAFDGEQRALDEKKCNDQKYQSTPQSISPRTYSECGLFAYIF